jgi:hypothetical protein
MSVHGPELEEVWSNGPELEKPEALMDRGSTWLE